MTHLTQLLGVLALATTVALAQPTVKVSGPLGDVTPIRMITNSRGDTVVSARTNTSGVLLVKLANQSDFTIVYDDQGKADKIALGGPGNPFTNDLSSENFTIYFTTLDALGTQRKTWEMPLSGGPAKMLGELGVEVKVLLSQFNYAPVVKKLELVSAVREDAKGQKLMYTIITGYLGYFLLQADGSFREVLLTGKNQYIFAPSGIRIGSTSADLTLMLAGGRLQLNNYNFQAKNLKPIVEIGSTLGNEGVQSWFDSMSSWKETTFRYKTAIGGRVARVVDGLPIMAYTSSQPVDDHAVNLAHLFVRQGNRILMVDGLNSATAIASVGDTFAGKTIREFSLPTLSAHGCSVNFMAKTDTSTSGSPHLFTAALPCILQAPTEAQGGTQVSLTGQNFKPGNPSRVEVGIAGLGVFPATVISDSELNFNVPNVNCTACAMSVIIDGVPSNKVPFTVTSSTPPPIISAGGVVNGASFEPGISPGSTVSIFGTNFATAPAMANSTPLPTTLADTQVFIGGKAMPLMYSSAGQINLQLPADTPVGKTTLKVVRNGVASSEVVIEVLVLAPAIYQNPNAMPNGLFFDTTSYELAGTAGNPLKRGRPYFMYATGLGKTSCGTLAAGTPAPADVLCPILGQVKLEIGGEKVKILFAGWAPGYLVSQINFELQGEPASEVGVVSIPQFVSLSVDDRPAPEVQVQVQQ